MRNRLRMKRARIAATIVAVACAIKLTSAECVAQTPAFRRAETFEDAHAASCRVCVEGARGTGFFVGADGADAYVVTNCHVVTTNRVAKLDFWTNGKMESVSGRVVWRYFDVETPGDFAALVVDSGELKTIDPPFLALGGADARPSVGALIVSCGAPDGRFPQAWKGQILEYFNGATAVFSPPPVPGQSGSPICEFVDGELFVTGILTWLIGEKGQDDSKGGAIPIMNLYSGLNRPNAPVDFRDPNASAIPPGAVECASRDVAADGAEGALVSRLNAQDNSMSIGRETTGSAPRWARASGSNMIATQELQVISSDQSAQAPSPSDSTPLLDDPEIEPKIENNFRNRPSVREFADDLKIFEDSDRRWRDRGKEKAPRQDNESESDDAKANSKISERLIDGALDSLSRKFENKLDEKIDSFTRKLLGKWNAVKYALLVGGGFALVVAILIAEALVALAKTFGRRLKNALNVAGRKSFNVVKGDQND